MLPRRHLGCGPMCIGNKGIPKRIQCNTGELQRFGRPASCATFSTVGERAIDDGGYIRSEGACLV